MLKKLKTPKIRQKSRLKSSSENFSNEIVLTAELAWPARVPWDGACRDVRSLLVTIELMAHKDNWRFDNNDESSRITGLATFDSRRPNKCSLAIGCRGPEVRACIDWTDQLWRSLGGKPLAKNVRMMGAGSKFDAIEFSKRGRGEHTKCIVPGDGSF
jgi:hypothetical protein